MNRFHVTCASIVLCLLFASSPVRAQESNPDLPVVVAFTRFVTLEDFPFPLKLEGHRVNGLLEGTLTISFPDGRTIRTEQYLNGQLHGLFTTFLPNGSKRSEESFVNGEKHGITKIWSEDGKLIAVLSHIHNTLHGPQEFFYLNGKRAAKPRFQSGQLHGTLQEYNLEGDLITIAKFDNGEGISNREIRAKTRNDERAAELRTEEQQRDFMEFWAMEAQGMDFPIAGKDVDRTLDEEPAETVEHLPGGGQFSFPTKVRKRLMSESGLGRIAVYTEDNKLIFESQSFQGVQHGDTIYYWPNGNRHSALVVSCGMLQGAVEFYDEDGTKITGGTNVQNLMHGLFTDYHLNGKKCFVQATCMGQRQGMLQVFSSNGEPLFIQNYEDDQRAGQQVDWLEMSDRDLKIQQELADLRERTIFEVWEDYNRDSGKTKMASH